MPDGLPLICYIARHVIEGTDLVLEHRLRTTAPIGSQETDSGTSALFSGHRFVPMVQICMYQIHAPQLHSLLDAAHP